VFFRCKVKIAKFKNLLHFISDFLIEKSQFSKQINRETLKFFTSIHTQDIESTFFVIDSELKLLFDVIRIPQVFLFAEKTLNGILQTMGKFFCI
jgi:hypothetical protein